MEEQNVVAPGLVLGRSQLWHRIGFSVGAGYQIATTHFHSNHNTLNSSLSVLKR